MRFLLYRMLAGLALSPMVLAAPYASAAPLTEVGLPLGNEADPYAPAVARMLHLLTGYTRWPEPRERLRLCVIEPADHADVISSSAFAKKTGIGVLPAAQQDMAGKNCDIVYIGRLSMDAQRKVTRALRGKPVLTVAENDPACRSQAMICLLFEAESLSFRLNVDAVSRSQVRIDPRVLRMGMEADE